MDLNSDLNMLSDPEHPQALEHHVQLKAGMYESERVHVPTPSFPTPSRAASISATVCLRRWAAFSWRGPEAVSRRAAEGFPATGSRDGRTGDWVRGSGRAVRVGALRPPPLGSGVSSLQRCTEPWPACVPRHQQETEI